MSASRLYRWLLRYCLPAILSCLSSPVQADSIDDLHSAGRLEVAVTIEPTQALVPGQKARLLVEVATPGWFWGGTRIGIPEVAGLIILQTEQFANNASENRNGQRWVRQRWSLDVYPQRAGDFTIPPLQLQLKVNAGDGNVEGQFTTTGIQLRATLPAALEQAEHWVAAPQFEVRQSFDRALNKLVTGDAFTRHISFDATDVMAMMLPAFTAEQHRGLAAYADPPLLTNSSNRGRNEASRSQSISYVIEAAGHYQLPAREYFWWDTTHSRLKLVTLPAIEFTVLDAAKPEARAAISINRPLVLVSALALVILIGVVILVRRWLSVSWISTMQASLCEMLQGLRRPALPERLNPEGEQ